MQRVEGSGCTGRARQFAAQIEMTSKEKLKQQNVALVEQCVGGMISYNTAILSSGY